jgi:DNA-binding transcriptional MocR family regulator
MPKRPAGSLVDVEISFSGNTPLHRQLYVALKNAILRGRLRPGARLPSTRAIADDLGVSRTTVLNAFDQLSAEGYLEGAVGSGTRVTPSIPGDLKKLAAKGGVIGFQLGNEFHNRKAFDWRTQHANSCTFSDATQRLAAAKILPLTMILATSFLG